MARKTYPTLSEKREASARRLAGIAQALGDDVQVELLPNNMAAGPCSACLAASQEHFRPAQAPLGPLEGCPHPDQCVIFYRAVEEDMEAMAARLLGRPSAAG